MTEAMSEKIEAYGRYYLEGFRMRVSDLRRELARAEEKLLNSESQFATGRMVTGYPTGESPIERMLEGPKQKSKGTT